MQYTPESYARRVTEFDQFDEGTRFPIRTVEELAARRVSDLEQAVCATLDTLKYATDNAELIQWLRSLATDRSYVGLMQAENPWKLAEGWLERNYSLYLWRLGVALVAHRLSGEEGASTTTHIGFGLSVTSSLAAAYVEFTRGLADLASAALDRGEDQVFNETSRRRQ